MLAQCLWRLRWGEHDSTELEVSREEVAALNAGLPQDARAQAGLQP